MSWNNPTNVVKSGLEFLDFQFTLPRVSFLLDQLFEVKMSSHSVVFSHHVVFINDLEIPLFNCVKLIPESSNHLLLCLLVLLQDLLLGDDVSAVVVTLGCILIDLVLKLFVLNCHKIHLTLGVFQFDFKTLCFKKLVFIFTLSFEELSTSGCMLFVLLLIPFNPHGSGVFLTIKDLGESLNLLIETLLGLLKLPFKTSLLDFQSFLVTLKVEHTLL